MLVGHHYLLSLLALSDNRVILGTALVNVLCFLTLIIF